MGSINQSKSFLAHGSLLQEVTVGVYHWSLQWEVTMGVYHWSLPRDFTMGGYHGSLLQEVTMGVYHRSLPQEVTTGGHRGSEWLWFKLATSSHTSLQQPCLGTDMAAQGELSTAPSPQFNPSGLICAISLHVQDGTLKAESTCL